MRVGWGDGSPGALGGRANILCRLRKSQMKHEKILVIQLKGPVHEEDNHDHGSQKGEPPVCRERYSLPRMGA